MSNQDKSNSIDGVARNQKIYILCMFFGIFGAHRFYLRQKWLGVLYIFTFGLCFVGWIYDIFNINSIIKSANKINIDHGEDRRKIYEKNPDLILPPKKYLKYFINEFIQNNFDKDSDSKNKFIHKIDYFTNSRGLKIFTQSWTPTNAKAVICYFHGYTANTVGMISLVLEKLASKGFIIYAMDGEGHGLSDGLYCLINDFSEYSNDFYYFYDKKAKLHQNLPCFFMSESMGGASTIYTLMNEIKYKNKIFSGGVFLSPMIKIADELIPSPIIVSFLKILSRLFPRAAITPTKDITDLCFQSEDIINYARNHILSYTSPVRLRTGYELLKATEYCSKHMDKVNSPVMICHSPDDQVNSYQNSKEFYEKIKNSDKILKTYHREKHVLLFGSKGKSVFNDILEWYNDRI